MRRKKNPAHGKKGGVVRREMAKQLWAQRFAKKHPQKFRVGQIVSLRGTEAEVEAVADADSARVRGMRQYYVRFVSGFRQWVDETEMSRQTRYKKISAISNKVLNAWIKEYNRQWPGADVAHAKYRMKNFDEATRKAYVKHLRALVLLVETIPGWKTRSSSRQIRTRALREIKLLGGRAKK